ncbi:hypothetical protein H8B02_37055 [Bradyrhizobium sp. Pear77]|uniref:hypothetical protein n=1 Tax=Bradyrhizobium TaxID=374 RepID=UPI0028975424|nr:hypothetical protein [Bradyrhizobium altum]MCC8958827.1 hypothetical protein [Bradyrhizobium altum]MCC8961824.1 hypothetical protein [Bradyrhizobium oropedii]
MLLHKIWINGATFCLGARIERRRLQRAAVAPTTDINEFSSTSELPQGKETQAMR